MSVRLNTSFVGEAADAAKLSAIQPEITAAHEKLHNGTGAGNAFLGWVDLPVNYDKKEFARIKAAAEKIKKDSEILIVIGIGGSYLGARAAIEFVKSQKYNDVAANTPKIYFAGNTISSSTLAELIDICKDKDFSVNVISKSGTTTEPALAFRISETCSSRSTARTAQRAASMPLPINQRARFAICPTKRAMRLS